jgi:adhesin transport system outer membrane protein
MLFSGQRNKLLHQAEAVSAQLDVIKAQAFPSVVAGVQHVWGGLVPYGYYPHDTGYVALQFQPGAGLSALSARNAASLKKDAAQQELMAFDRTLKNQILTTLSDLESAQSQITPAQLILNGSLDVVASYLRQYQVGRRSWIEVLNAQRELTQAAYSLIDLQVAVQQNQVKLMLLTGDINPQQYDDIHE